MKAKKVIALVMCAAMVAGMSASSVMAGSRYAGTVQRSES